MCWQKLFFGVNLFLKIFIDFTGLMNIILLEKEIADISIEYEEPISKYSKEIKKSIDGGDIEHIVDLFYAKFL